MQDFLGCLCFTLNRSVWRQEPMFCFETALKALYWSILVYRYEQSAPDQTRDPIKVCPIAFLLDKDLNSKPLTP